jgi:hypothetical protein
LGDQAVLWTGFSFRHSSRKGPESTAIADNPGASCLCANHWRADAVGGQDLAAAVDAKLQADLLVGSKQPPSGTRNPWLLF